VLPGRGRDGPRRCSTFSPRNLLGGARPLRRGSAVVHHDQPAQPPEHGGRTSRSTASSGSTRRNVMFFPQGVLPSFGMDGMVAAGEQGRGGDEPRWSRRLDPGAARERGPWRTCGGGAWSRSATSRWTTRSCGPSIRYSWGCTLARVGVGGSAKSSGEMSSKMIRKERAGGEGRGSSARSTGRRR